MFWKRKNNNQQKSISNYSLESDFLADMTSHAYVLGHIAFREYCESDPVSFFDKIVNGKADDVLESVWTDVRKKCGEVTGKFDIAQVEIVSTSLNGKPTAFVIIPSAENKNNITFSVLVFNCDQQNIDEQTKPSFRHILLGVGVGENGQPLTISHEWCNDEPLNKKMVPIDDMLGILELGRSVVK